MSGRFPNVGRSPRFDLAHVSVDEVLAEREHRGPRRAGTAGAHYDLCSSASCPCYREGLRAGLDALSEAMTLPPADDR